MSADELLGRTFWRDTANELRGVGLAWWEENRNDLVQLTREEAEDVFEDLQRGRTADAKLSMVARMSREEWKAYRDGTTDRLEGIAQRRARLLDALSELGVKAAQAIGNAALGALRS